MKEATEKSDLVFEFGKYTEITDLAFELRPNYKNEHYVRFFICPDVWDFWFVRVLKGFNEEYVPTEGIFLIERNNIGKSDKSEKLTLSKVKEIIRKDEGDGYDQLECNSMEEVIEELADIFGIHNLKEA